MKLRIFLLFSMLLSFIAPCSATRPLREIVRNNLYRNVAFPVPSGELLRKVQRLSDDYEAKILDNLQRLSVASMRDLLAFLKKDALSLEEILTKINTGGYQNPSEQERRKDTCCFYELSRWSFDEISRKLPKQPTDTSEQNFRHLSVTTVEVFREAELLFNEYVQACAEIFGITDEIGRIVRNGIRSFYNLKKSEMLYNELHNDPWYLGAAASNGSWSTVVHSILSPPEKQRTKESKTEELKAEEFKAEQIKSVIRQRVEFNQERAEKFIGSVTENFNTYDDGSTANDAGLREDIKQQFRANCIEYLLRGVYTYYETPSPERDKLVSDIFEYARKTSDDSALQPSK